MHLSKLRVRGLRAAADGELELALPGRFCVLVGANASGKSTVSDALYLGHSKRFPHHSPPSSAALGTADRDIEVEYSFEVDGATEGPLGRALQTQSGRNAPGTVAAMWARTLHRDLGRVATKSLVRSEVEDRTLLVHLPAWRNPVDELARREVRILVELLRAQQQNRGQGRDLTSLRARASGLLERLATDGLLEALEQRVGEHLRSLSAGVSRNWPYIRGQVVDDRYLARVLELMLSSMEGREHALPLEVAGLGYVNLLHIAVTLAAIPDPTEAATAAAERAAAGGSGGGGGEVGEAGAATEAQTPGRGETTANELDDATRRLEQARAESESADDSFFPEGAFHVTLVIEEPEAHLHPQLQHSLVRYLRRETQRRPELQVILSSHATDIITSCDPLEIVVLRRDARGQRVCRSIARIPMAAKDDVLQKTRLHLDASRSASLFAALATFLINFLLEVENYEHSRALVASELEARSTSRPPIRHNARHHVESCRKERSAAACSRCVRLVRGHALRAGGTTTGRIMSITRRRGVLAFAAAALCAAMTGGTAHAGTPADWVDPGTEGSLVDTQNLIGATSSDLSATGAATDGRCSSTATTPAERFDPNSDTRRVIFSRVTLTCVGGDKDEYWRLQRHRWNGWKTLTSIELTDATNFTADLVTNCRAGTWSYRVEANEYKTKSYRTACSRPDDIFFIDNAAQ